MKKVIFVCLLSLAVGFSKPAAENEPNALPTNAKVPQGSTGQPQESQTQASGAKPIEPQKQPETTIPSSGTSVATNNKDVTLQNNTTAVTNATAQAPNATKDNPVTDKTTGTAVNNATATTKNETKASTEVPAVPDKSTEKTNSTDSSSVKPEEKSSNATESSGTKGSTTTKPTDATKADPIVQGRSFDGPSFIGGIILTLGLIAIGFMGFKYYKAQARNYHTL